MFGYITVHKPEMKMKEFETYRAYYCGLCKEIHKQYGVFSRLLLNYDLVFAALLKDGLAEEKGEYKSEGCIINPIGKQVTLHNTSGLAFGSDGLILLSYHKLQDSLRDEKFLKRIGLYLVKPYLYFKHKKAQKKYPEIDALLAEQMQRQFALEQENCKSVDMACDPTAQMCSALFAALASTESEKRILARFGIFVGQVVYLLDAADDYNDDIKNQSYNVFVNMDLSKQQAIQTAQTRCRMAAGEMANCYNLLTLARNKDILDNIIFLGIPAAISAVGKQAN